MPFDWIEEEGGVHVIYVKARLLLHDHADLKERFERAVASGGRKFVVDLSAMDLVTTPFLGLLVSLKKKAAVAGGKLVLAGPSPYTHEILDLTRLSRVFDVHPDRASAVKQVRSEAD